MRVTEGSHQPRPQDQVLLLVAALVGRPKEVLKEILSREYRAGEIIIVDADNAEMTFRLMEEIRPPLAELAGAVSSDKRGRDYAVRTG